MIILQVLLLVGILFWYLRLGPRYPLYTNNMRGYAVCGLFTVVTLLLALHGSLVLVPGSLAVTAFTVWSVAGGPSYLVVPEIFYRGKHLWFDKLLTRTRL